jgi:putative SOS response-associated peptidase YedK
MAGHAKRKAALAFHGPRWVAGFDGRRPDEWRDKANSVSLKSCTMIITEPNKFVGEVHDRMPVLLTESEFEPWLSGSSGAELLKPASEVWYWPGQ